MNQADNSKQGYPTPEQELVLQAAFLPQEVAITAWHKWLEAIDIEDHDTESYHLFPFIYRNLSDSQLDIPEIVRLKGVYKRRWYENKIVFAKLTTILTVFQEAGIKTLLLKDAALATHYCQDNGCRYIYHLDILVSPADASAAIALLKNMGWQPKTHISERLISVYQGLGFEDKSKYPLNLQWHVFPSAFQDNPNDEFWQRAITTKVGDISTYVLEPTHQLLSLCLQVYPWTTLLPIRWLTDATIILNSSQTYIDWNRLIEQAQRYQLILPLTLMLNQLKKLFPDSVPTAILEQLAQVQVSQFEQIEYQIKTKQNISVLNAFFFRYFHYLRSVSNNNLAFKLFGFPKYLQYVWELEYIWEVPYQVMVRGMRRMLR
ncbi:nucleotidyltransferase family protein [Limnofasciculus baicalensis]|uniref:Nucleotidyltransferase family protein n=1 Tax=Limnofasciculus baicalensis BBK-W-15 TaxID=2699891 RepID=A0AAE3KL51_9CYAN|nr:nucleotidyltransferase family protein [Limnofasciculus baicalensis]MCP2727291.1 nucleotidyltransferase family protein [Limnofasciculus baicalensis BBK-W-15]